METPWFRLLAYYRLLPVLEAEESLRWLPILHPKDPQKLQQALRRQAGAGSPVSASPEEALTGWQLDPNLAGGIIEVDELPLISSQ